MIKTVIRFGLMASVSALVMVQAVSLKLGSPSLPEPWITVGAIPLHGPSAIAQWEAQGLITGKVRLLALSVFGGSFALLFLAWVKNYIARKQMESVSPWGTLREAARAKLLTRKGVVLGRLGWRMLRDNGDNHMFIMAPPGAGKSTTIGFPTLLGGWRQAAIIHDAKGEYWAKTSAWRKKHVGPTLRFDLTDPYTVRYNPLSEIRWGTVYKIGDTQALARAIVPKGFGNDSYFENLALQFLTGLILYVGETQKRPCLGAIQTLASSFEEAIPLIAKSGHPEGRQIAGKLDKADAKMRSIFESEILSHIWLFADPLVSHATSESDFKAGDLVCEERPLSLYLCAPARHKDRLAPVNRIIIQSLIGMLCEREKHDIEGRKKKHRLLAFIDEFPVLGRMDPIKESMGIVRSYGVKVVLVAQGSKQIADIYGSNHSFLEMCTTIWITAGADPGSLSGYSQMTGDTKEYRRSITSDGRPSFSEQIRPRLSAGAIRELDMREAIVLAQGAKPLKVQKLRTWSRWSPTYWKFGGLLETGSPITPPPAEPVIVRNKKRTA